MDTTVVITYIRGTQDMLKVCLAALNRNNAGLPCKVKIITDLDGFNEAKSFLPADTDIDYTQEILGPPETIKSNIIIRCARGLSKDMILEAFNLGTTPISGSTMHGVLLDAAMKSIDTDYVLTLDSDCFPIAPNWLKKLMDMQDNGATLSGILWPWIPAPSDIKPGEIEYRVRRLHCWNNTQVACQLVKTSFIRDNNLSFTPGDDTSFRITEKVWQLGQRIEGLMPTCCPVPVGEGLDPEFNRHRCVVYGDMIYHHGGATRQKQGVGIDPYGFFTAAGDRVFAELGAEWILRECYRFKFDREEEVAQYKMRSMFQGMVQYLRNNDSLFAIPNTNKI